MLSKISEYQKLVKEVKEAGIYPYFHTLESKQDTVVEMEGDRKIMIGSNNYQGLTSHPRVIKAAVEATEKFGSGCSGSRFLNGTTTLHLELEKELAEFLAAMQYSHEQDMFDQLTKQGVDIILVRELPYVRVANYIKLLKEDIDDGDT